MLSPAGRRRPDPAAVPGWGWLEKPEGVRGLGMPGWHGEEGWLGAPTPWQCAGTWGWVLRQEGAGAPASSQRWGGTADGTPRPRHPSSPHRPFQPLSGARSTPKFPVP